MPKETRDMLANRSTNLGIESVYQRRAFWDHWCEKLPSDKSVGDYFTDNNFLDAVRSTWVSLGSKANYTLQYKHAPGATEIPPLPTEGYVPKAPNDSTDPLVEAKDEVSDEDGEDLKIELEPQNFAASLQTSESIADEGVTTKFNINELFSNSSIAEYEKGVVKGLDILANLRKALDAAPGADSEQWLTSIAKLEAQAERTRTVIGVVGATGAGKSSVINAMLDEERLLPTNCMRACTAVVTEISYNFKNELYRAEIEFIGQDDWRKELTILYQELLDANGNIAREAAINEDSEAGIAWSKLKAVYPHMTKEDLARASVDQLIQHKNARVLGTVRDLDSKEAPSFYEQLQRFVDSKEESRRITGRPANEQKAVQQVEYWPLIKVVRIYVRAPALQSGAVIVDLPGVHDSNQARAAVAQRYMKACAGLWIVAPITRAVDDKSAKTLLGESFKRQLKIDGAYNSVTFICSKTDDISITEAIDSLELDDVLQSAYDKIQELSAARRVLQTKFDSYKEQIDDINTAVDKADEELEVWEQLLSKCQDGETVYPPAPKKRKRTASPKARKRPKYTEADSDDDFIASDNSDESDRDELNDSDDEAPTRSFPVSENEATAKVEELRSTKKEGRRRKLDIETELKDFRKRIAANKQEQEKYDAVISTECIAGRNNYSRDAIKQDFAAGIKELDQEIAEEEDAANFDPEEDIRDYDEVAASLPVFCVSSRAYQKMCGRFKKDKHVLGFETLEATEIPALQKHCSKLTEANREAACKRFLNSMNALLNSLRLWSSSDGSSANLTDDQLRREKDILEDKLGKLDSALEKQIRNVSVNIKDELEHNLYSVFPAAIEASKAQANDTVAKLARPYNRDAREESGLHYSTYKAVCRRDGVYTNFAGLHHFNEQLTEPIIKYIANGWEKTFSRRVPGVLTTLVSTVDKLLNTFHDEVEKRAIRNGGSMARFYMLRNQLQAYREVIKDASNRTKVEISTRQKDCNREFVPVITLNMLPAYQLCTDEHGKGSFRRMKTHMDQHVDTIKQTMFAASTDEIKRRITAMLKDAQDQLEAGLDEIFISMKRDYTQLVTGVRSNAERLPRDQRIMRKEVLDLVNGSKLRFERVVGLASPSPEPEVPADLVADESANNIGEASKSGQSTFMLSYNVRTSSNNVSEPKSETKAQTPLPAIPPEQPKSTFEEEIAMSPCGPASFGPPAAYLVGLPDRIQCRSSPRNLKGGRSRKLHEGSSE
ncbi:hypothetical protein OHC33_008733 [Knufia fluminis]|uniref:Nuclear GTPase SLIP-GC n=1 Tax=Knufia fluminis TaxID=191047 RepID=A0AAN8EA21_9EURO|nr:hypothetical protein OHC33_008733 [Knufia fluminis]